MVKNEQKKRAANTKDVGKIRQSLYAHCHKQIQKAIADKYYLEAIALCESIIGDRLEARMACLTGNLKREMKTIGQHVHAPDPKRAKDSLIALDNNMKYPKKLSLQHDKLMIIYPEIREWTKRRNTCVHEMAKLVEDYASKPAKWDDRFEEARKCADDGSRIARTLGRAVQALNTYDYKNVGVERD